ncbi:MAG: CYTH domain-containing protein [Candidatus Woesearchaeota archaeon]
MQIEVEIRSLITKEKYLELKKFLDKNAKLTAKDHQETIYFKARHDLRIQKNNTCSKIWMKKGKIHDEQREETEIRFERDDFEKILQMLLDLGFEIDVKWIRERLTYFWEGIDVMLDDTKGYGQIIELEKKATEGDKDAVLDLLKSKLEELGIKQTPRDEFDKKLSEYRKNWKKLIGRE